MTVVSGVTIEADRRVVVGAAATLTFRLVDADGEPSVVGAAPTIGIVNAAGIVVVAPGTATVAGDPGVYTFALPAQTRPDVLVVTWTSGATARVEHVEIVGRVLWSIADAQDRDKSFTAGTWTNSEIIRARRRAEDECYALTGRRFAPWYQRTRIPSPRRLTSQLVLPEWDVRVVRDVAEVDTGGAVSSWTTADLLNVAVYDPGLAVIRDGTYWPDLGEIVVGFEFGLDRAPEAIIDATIRRARYWLARPGSSLLDRATNYTPDGAGGTYRIIQPGPGTTGDPEVDAIYARHGRRTWGVA